MTGDDELVAAQDEWHRGKPSEVFNQFIASNRLTYQGQRAAGYEMRERAVALARQFGMGAMVDRFRAPTMVTSELEFGDLESAREYLEQVTVDEGNRNSMAWVAGLMAQLGEIERAQELLDRLVDEYPDTTWVHANAAPRIRAAIAMTAGRPEEAVAELRKARFERSDLSLPFEKGKALLAAGKPEEALVEFQKIRDWKGIDPIDLSRAVTLVWMGRSYVAAGDTEAARDLYLEFFELWVDADEDIPLLQKARSEYEALPGVKG